VRKGEEFGMPFGYCVTVIENSDKAKDDYGHRFGSSNTFVTQENVQALLAGKYWAFYDGEYSHFITLSEDPKVDARM